MPFSLNAANYQLKIRYFFLNNNHLKERRCFYNCFCIADTYTTQKSVNMLGNTSNSYMKYIKINGTEKNINKRVFADVKR